MNTMFLITRSCSQLAFTLLLCLVGTSQAVSAETKPLRTIVENTIQATLTRFATNKLASDQIALTLVDLSDPDNPVSASHRGTNAIYPASVIKLFYLAAAHRWLEDKKLPDAPELQRALRDMIVDSSNEATHYVLDLLTDTTSGPELPEAELQLWFEKRNAVNRYFTSLGYTGINANRKPWCEGPYGRESQSIRLHDRKRNLLTTEATARLLVEIATRKSITPARSEDMLKLMKRKVPDAGAEGGGQVGGFIGGGLPPGTKLWSKAGWTSETRHDAAYLNLPTGQKFVLVVFTVNHATNRQLLPFITRQVVAQLQ